MSDGNTEEQIDQVIAYVRRAHGLIIGELTAEEAIRLSFSPAEMIEVRGRDAETGRPRAVRIWYDDIWRAIRD